MVCLQHLMKLHALLTSYRISFQRKKWNDHYFGNYTRCYKGTYFLEIEPKKQQIEQTRNKLTLERLKEKNEIMFVSWRALTHLALEYFEKLAFKRNKKNNKKHLNASISKARANSELKLTFSESSFNFLQNRVAFCTLYPRGNKAEDSVPYNRWCSCQRLARLKGLRRTSRKSLT